MFQHFCDFPDGPFISSWDNQDIWFWYLSLPLITRLLKKPTKKKIQRNLWFGEDPCFRCGYITLLCFRHHVSFTAWPSGKRSNQKFGLTTKLQIWFFRLMKSGLYLKDWVLQLKNQARYENIFTSRWDKILKSQKRDVMLKFRKAGICSTRYGAQNSSFFL